MTAQDNSVTLVAMKNQHAVALGRLGGLRGGPSRMRSLSPEKRSEIARKASRARWSKGKVDMQRLADDRVYRRDLANKFARGTDVDPGDLEHALFNLTLPPMERLARALS